MSYNKSGDKLAVGDRDGRMVMFASREGNATFMKPTGYFFPDPPLSPQRNRAINHIEWLPRHSQAHELVFTATEHVVQLWRLPACPTQLFSKATHKHTWHGQANRPTRAVSLNPDCLTFLVAEPGQIKLHRCDDRVVST
eukprot:TRINITY_DN10167_c0_g1::TRINITY_DN10167_c0_g1_i1::g.7657::m.7657 TRINITY_DN10167_c0_g1::TRINITY_DN10167_c0_g1_i1::g.7657  ORF type:complete len:139 (-),score=10.97 TRINITY_DN10167_c0_g1_i1:74-490(-)